MSTTSAITPTIALPRPTICPPARSTCIGGLSIALGACFSLPYVAAAGAILLGRSFLHLRAAQNSYTQYTNIPRLAQTLKANTLSLYGEMVREGLSLKNYASLERRFRSLRNECLSIQGNHYLNQDSQMRESQSPQIEESRMYLTVIAHMMNHFRTHTQAALRTTFASLNRTPPLTGDANAIKLYIQSIFKILLEKGFTPNNESVLEGLSKSLQETRTSASNRMEKYLNVLKNALVNHLPIQPVLHETLQPLDDQVSQLWNDALTPNCNREPLTEKSQLLLKAINQMPRSGELSSIREKLAVIQNFLEGREPNLRTVLFAAQKLFTDCNSPPALKGTEGEASYQSFITNQVAQFGRLYQLLQGTAIHQISDCPEYLNALRLLHAVHRTPSLSSGLLNRGMDLLPNPIQIPPSTSSSASPASSRTASGVCSILHRVGAELSFLRRAFS